MAAISQSIPTLLGGVSQQPDPVKLPGQVRRADNVYLDPTFGCVKRPATKYVKDLASNIPNDAKWFPIFRDNNERYLACYYRTDTREEGADKNNVTIRVFEADSGIERSVAVPDRVKGYLRKGSANLQMLTINDYTFICNPDVEVSMSSGRSDSQAQEALVVINQIGYNTTYSIDLLRDGDELAPVEKTRATELGVRPGSFDVEDDEGGCEKAGVQEFTEENGLKYRLTVNCTPVQVTDYEDGDPYPTQAEISNLDEENFAEWAAIEFGNPRDVGLNSYAYSTKNVVMDKKNIAIRIEARAVKICTYGESSDGVDKNLVKWSLSSVDVVSYEGGGNGKNKWEEGADGTIEVEAETDLEAGFSAEGIDVCDGDNRAVIPEGTKRRIKIEVIGLDKGPKTPVYSYKSSYSASVQLLNGGVGPKKGDTYEQNFKGQTYVFKVKKDSVTYAYEAEASVSYTTPSDTTSGSLDVGNITGELISGINALNGYEAQGIGNVIYIKRTNNRKFNVSARGGSTENAMYGIKGSVSDVSKLPSVGFEGVILLVQNTVDSEADDYYVRFQTTQGIPGAGSWEETVKPGIKTSFNASTMPLAMRRREDGSFKIIDLNGTEDDDIISWADREVGDDNSNPLPSFVGKKINNMVFHMNRFGFLSEDTVVLSQPGDYFNFFVGSAIAVSDSDPIDMAATSTRPANLIHSISTPQGLVLFTTDAQFLMGTKDVAFGPSTVQIDEISNYSFRATVPPIEVGTSIFFNTNSTNYSKVFEMSTESIGQSPQVAEDTRIVPEFIPNNIKWGAASSNNNLAVYGTTGKYAYCFKYWNQGKERSLAGWFRWRFPMDLMLLSFADDVGYLVFYNDETEHTVLAKMNLMDDPDVATIWADSRSFEPKLDLYVPKDQLSITNGEDTKRIELPTGAYAGQEFAVLQFTEPAGTYFTQEQIQFDNDDTKRNPHIIVDNFTLRKSLDYNLGIAYEMRVDLPTFYVKEDNKVDRVNIPMVETVNIELYLSGSYTVRLNRLGYPARNLYFDSKEYDIYRADKNPIVDSSKQELHVFARGDHADVSIRSADPLPAGISGYTWEGHYSTRGINRIQ